MKGTGSAARSLPDASGPVPATRERLLELAGYDEDRQATLLGAALARIEATMTSAPTTQRLVVGVGRGVSQVQEFVDEDEALRLRAATEMVQAMGGYPSRSAGLRDSGGAKVEITFRDMAPRPRVDVTPRDG